MPVYDYKCSEHGVFNELASLADAGLPCACPQCAQLSPRVIVLPPELLDMDSQHRKAHATNERARHEPVISTSERRQHDHQHRHGCGCTQKKPGKSKLMYTAQGEKMFPSARPWMISH